VLGLMRAKLKSVSTESVLKVKVCLETKSAGAGLHPKPTGTGLQPESTRVVLSSTDVVASLETWFMGVLGHGD
jgi:hypothetical protein